MKLQVRKVLQRNRAAHGSGSAPQGPDSMDTGARRTKGTTSSESEDTAVLKRVTSGSTLGMPSTVPRGEQAESSSVEKL